MHGFKDCAPWRLAALAAAAALSFAAPARAGDPETCDYQEDALARACADDPAVRAYLLKPAHALIERLADIPPAVRGWFPGEAAAVYATALEYAEQVKAGCGFEDADFARACMLDADLRDAAHALMLPKDASWFHLPFDVAGWAPYQFDRRRLADNPGATRQRVEWNHMTSREDLIRQIERAVSRGVRQQVTLVRLYLVAVDGRNFVACGYGFYDGGGYEPPSAGLFILDSLGGSAIRARRDHFNGLCGLSDVVLR